MHKYRSKTNQILPEFAIWKSPRRWNIFHQNCLAALAIFQSCSVQLFGSQVFVQHRWLTRSTTFVASSTVAARYCILQKNQLMTIDKHLFLLHCCCPLKSFFKPFRSIRKTLFSDQNLNDDVISDVRTCSPGKRYLDTENFLRYVDDERRNFAMLLLVKFIPRSLSLSLSLSHPHSPKFLVRASRSGKKES